MRTLSILGPRALAALTFALAASAPHLAHALECSDVLPDATYPNKIWGSGGSAATATIKAIAIELAKLPEPITIVYADPGACDGFKEFVTNSSITNRSFKYWSAEGVESTCTATGHALDFSHMGNTDAWCSSKLADAVIPSGEFLAPVQVVNFITDKDSTQDVISAEALYYIYGIGAGATGQSVAPWTDPFKVWGRKSTSFLQQFVSALIFDDINRAGAFKIANGTVPAGEPTHFLGSQQELIDKLVASGATSQVAAEATLGFVSGSAARDGSNADNVKVLAYQHYDQTCAYLPDSSPTKVDRANVRSGQYFPWSQGHFYARVDNDGKASNPTVKNLIDWVQGTADAPNGIDVQWLVTKAGDVPLCAMHAIRSEGDFSPIQSYQPDAPCNGYYEYKLTGDTDYTACTDDTECTDADFPKCRGFGGFKFCEAK